MFLPFVQAEVEGQKITWLTPHALQQVVPDAVDYKIMLTFLEFYEVNIYYILYFPHCYCSETWCRSLTWAFGGH